ncbi:MAG: preprotein translocase subunit SecY [Bacilli bacterium]|nr:preprotein translocase subunit SecY [Mollicutes bacterium]
MFATFKQIFRSSNKDLRARILFTLGVLFIFALGNSITIPGMNVITGDIGFLELFNAMSGGGLKQFSIFALGVMPYITASIIIQILQMDIIPYFKELKEMGEEGRRKIAKITRYSGLAIAFIQGFFYPMMFLGKTQEPMMYFKIAIILTAGTAFLLWLGDEITNKGIGNGVSLIIMAGIVNTLPSMFVTAFQSLIPNANNEVLAWAKFIIFILLYVFIVVGVIWVEQAERRIPIQYSNRSSSSYGGQQTFLPLKLNSANVMPVIIASVIMGIPSILAYFIKNAKVISFLNNYLSTSKPVGFVIYIILIIVFTYIYTFLTINPEELSKNLNKNGGYIPGIRPGTETKKYISKVLGRITFMGALFIALLAAIPTIFTALTGLPETIKLGGTSMLIAVGVLLETYKQLESSVASRNYSNRR